MNRVTLFKHIGLGSRLLMFKLLVPRQLFFSNSSIMSMKQGVGSTKTQFHRSNIEILQSSFNIFQRVKYTRYSSSSFGFGRGRSNTWKNYNRHYGNSNWNRLKGPTIFTALFCVGTTVIVPYLFQYTPLGWFKKRPSYLIYSIIALNGVVFLMWKNPGFLKPLTRYGLLVKDNVYSNWSLLGSAFSHQSFGHIFVNMFVLQSFGTSLCGILGASNFLIMYLNSAVISSFISILIPTLTRASLTVGSLGASGAIFSVVGAFSYLIPKAPIALFFIPIPGGAWFAFLGTVAYNVAGLFFRWGAYDYAAHLGGSIAGVTYGWYYSKKIREARRKAVRSSRF